MSRRTASRSILLAAALLVGGCSSFSLSAPAGDPDAMTAPISAAETRAEVARAMLDTPLPPGAAWKPVVVDDGWYGVWGGGSMIEFQALCAWLQEAIDAARADDAERLAAVDAMLVQIPSWRTFEDPALMDSVSRGMVRDLLADAARRDFGAVEGYLSANCE